MFCSRCGKEISDDQKVCDECKELLLSEINEEEKKETEAKEKGTKEKKKSKKGLIIVVVILAIIAFVIGFIHGYTNGDGTGNTIGNILNSGYAVEDAKYIYFIAPDSELVDVCIFRANKDGSDIQEIYRTKETLISLNSVGNNLFFLSLAQEYDNSGNIVINNKICRIDKSGDNFQVINDNEFHDACYEIYVIKDRVYYIGEDVNVYSMDLYGGTRTLVSDKERGYVAITEDYMIYNDYINEEAAQDETSTDFETYVLDRKTNVATVIEEDKKTYSTTIVGNDIYYTDDAGVIYKKTLDNLAANPTKICETEAYYMNVTNDAIYYMNYTDETQSSISIYKVDLDGSNNILLKTLDSASGSDFINIVDEWILYTDSDGVDLFMNLTNRYGEDKDVRVFNINIEEYWSKYLLGEDAEGEETQEGDDISLDTTVDEYENTVENTTKE